MEGVILAIGSENGDSAVLLRGVRERVKIQGKEVKRLDSQGLAAKHKSQPLDDAV